MPDDCDRLQRFSISQTKVDRAILDELAILIEEKSLSQVYRDAVWVLREIAKHGKDGYRQLFVVKPANKASRSVEWREILWRRSKRYGRRPASKRTIALRRKASRETK